MHDRSSIVKKNISTFYPQKRYSVGNFTGEYMTICIASYWGKDELIVALDTMLSTEFTTADMMAIKVRSIAPTWWTCFAANDISSVIPIYDRVRAKLKSGDNTLKVVSDIFAESYGEELLQKSERTVLSRFGLDMKEYLSGIPKLDSNVSISLYHEIRSVALDADFIVFGYDAGGDRHIFTVSNPGNVQNNDIEGFAAIGSGGMVAQMTILGYGSTLPGDELKSLYRVCAAKFMAESAIGVGRVTGLIYFRKDGSAGAVDDSDIRPIRELWQKEGKPHTPSQIKESADPIILKLKKVAADNK